MKILKKLVIGIVGFIVLLMVAGLFLPDSAQLERSIEISAPAAKVFPKVNSLRAYAQWAPWHNRDPQTVYTYSGAENGEGAIVVWQSDHPEVGSGRQEIIESRPFEFVKTSLDFGAQGMAVATFTLAESGQNTMVTWGFSTQFGYNIMGRYFGLVLESMLAPDYESGLKKLKEITEAAL